MKLDKAWYDGLRCEGRLTLQQPTLYIDFTGKRVDVSNFIEVPDSWFFLLTTKDVPLRKIPGWRSPNWEFFNRKTFGKEQGFTYISYEGFIANKYEICNSYAISYKNPSMYKELFEEFEEFAITFYLSVEINTLLYKEKQIKKLEAKIRELKQ